MTKYNRFLLAFIALAMPVMMSSCQVVGDIFKAGMWVGLIGVVVVILIIVAILRRL
jgi:uncharacterized membrane protein YcjF (UPF0283 family)